MFPSGKFTRNQIITPPPRFELLDALGEVVNTAAYEATVEIVSASNSNQQFGDGSQKTVVFDVNNQAIFDTLHFDYPGQVSLSVT